MPVCFGISFTKTPMNQARSLVHVYTDGSVAVSTGAVEMGQGVNTKMAQVAAKVFSAAHRKSQGAHDQHAAHRQHFADRCLRRRRPERQSDADGVRSNFATV